MVYRFISKSTSHDIQGIGTLHNDYPFQTEDEAIAERLRKNKDVFEIKAKVFEKIEEAKQLDDQKLEAIPVVRGDVVVEPPAVEIARIKKSKPNIVGARTAREVKQEGE